MAKSIPQAKKEGLWGRLSVGDDVVACPDCGAGTHCGFDGGAVSVAVGATSQITLHPRFEFEAQINHYHVNKLACSGKPEIRMCCV